MTANIALTISTLTANKPISMDINKNVTLAHKKQNLKIFFGITSLSTTFNVKEIPNIKKKFGE